MALTMERRLRSAIASLRTAVLFCWFLGAIVLLVAPVLGWMEVYRGRDLQIFFFLRTLPLAVLAFAIGACVHSQVLSGAKASRRLLGRTVPMRFLMRYTGVKSSEGYVMELYSVDNGSQAVARAVVRANVGWLGRRSWKRQADVYVEDVALRGRILAWDGRFVYWGRFLHSGEVLKSGNGLVLWILFLLLFAGIFLALEYWYVTFSVVQP